MAVIKGLIMSFSMFSAIPVPSLKWDEAGKRYILLFMPVVGLTVGLLWYGSYILSGYLNVDKRLSSLLIMLTPFAVTGFLHTDGFADTCDACFSGRDLERKREILKDSHIGTFGAAALIMLFLISYIAAETCNGNLRYPPLLILIPIASRSTAAIAVYSLKSISDKGLGASFKASKNKADVYIMFCLVVCVLLAAFVMYGLNALLNMLGIFLISLISVIIPYRSLEGFSGDLAGFSITVTELAAIIILSIWG